MLKKIPNLLSIFLHPIFATTYLYFLILNSDSFVAFLPPTYKFTIIAFVAINTIALPLLLMVVLRRLKLIKDYLLHDNRERVLPIVLSIIPYFFTIFLFVRIGAPFILIKILQAGIYVLFLSAVISYFWKISLHMSGIGGIVGFILASALGGNSYATSLFILAVILSGFLASARLIKGDHKPAQVYAGFLLGFTVVFLNFI
ncbi:MAG: hypothetical protein PWR03_727 [Tenuifilum sp.]|jgi:hypothetical protein|uniref:hypothetical protein n=1 Tax=Tenuifilum sp. TaxID=2760880 RepID=UPI0024AA3CB7|nr:hypothetical protein [Tenuifilum sp.]MDI3526544.1 hypothetical protein [Tenuifilum sp.]